MLQHALSRGVTRDPPSHSHPPLPTITDQKFSNVFLSRVTPRDTGATHEFVHRSKVSSAGVMQ